MAYTWTVFPLSGTANFESTARGALETWRTNSADMETRLISVENVNTSQQTQINALTAASAWSGATTYDIGNMVTYDGNLYVSVQDTNLNHQPDTSNDWWTLWSSLTSQPATPVVFWFC